MAAASNDFNVDLFPAFYSNTKSDEILKELLKLPFYSVNLEICGRSVQPRRKVYAFSDSGVGYTFSGTCIYGEPWTPLILQLKQDVEEKTGAVFNFALLNYYEDGYVKISPHKDNEEDLDPNSPIASLSFGICRTVKFTRNNHSAIDYNLENGSLLVMNVPTNSFWFHEIPAERDIKSPRISVTFRKLLMQRKRKNSESLPPSKQAAVEDVFNGPSTDAFFVNMMDSSSSNLLPANQVPMGYAFSTSGNTFKNETVYKSHIGNNVCVTLELFRNMLSIHIRKFYESQKGEMLPTKTGVVMDTKTWYEFFTKLSNFNLIYAKSSFIANNNILALSYKDSMYIQSLNRQHSIQLNNNQINNLKDRVYDLNTVTMEYIFLKRFPYFVQCERRLLPILSVEEENILLTKLIICIENALREIFRDIFICNGCIIDHPSQRQHACLTTTCLDKFQMLGNEIFLLLDMKDVAFKFVESVDCISENFLKNLTVRSIEEIVFKSM